MNILMFGWEFPPFISGGLGTACAGLTRGLNAVGGVNTTFVLPRASAPSMAPPAVAEGGEAKARPSFAVAGSYVDSIRFVEIDSFLPAASTPKAAGRAPTARKTGSSYDGAVLTQDAMRYASSAAHLLDKVSHFDVIHAHDWLTYLAGVHAKKISGKPLVVHVHSTEFDRSGEQCNEEIYRIERFGMDMADKIIAVSNYTRDVIIDRYDQHPDKVMTIYNATEKCEVDRPAKAAGAARPVVTFLGRITYQKGPEYFVEAARLVLQQGHDVSFIMAGDGDLLPRMRSLVSALGIAQHFQFPGFINGADVRALLSRSDVYVMPSVSEPFGIAALEAINANVPTIVSTKCGMAELVDNVLKVAPDDCEAIAEAIVALIEDPAYARRLAREAGAELRKLSWDDSASDLKGLYRELLAATC